MHEMKHWQWQNEHAAPKIPLSTESYTCSSHVHSSAYRDSALLHIIRNNGTALYGFRKADPSATHHQVGDSPVGDSPLFLGRLLDLAQQQLEICSNTKRRSPPCTGQLLRTKPRQCVRCWQTALKFTAGTTNIRAIFHLVTLASTAYVDPPLNRCLGVALRHTGTSPGESRNCCSS